MTMASSTVASNCEGGGLTGASAAATAATTAVAPVPPVADEPGPDTDATTISSSNTMDLNSLKYDPDVMARYAHFYKTGKDINDPNYSPTTDDDTNGPPKKKKKLKKKHIPPIVLETRRIIQFCCRDNNLPLGLVTLHRALRELIRIEPATFYQLVNLCEGTFAERTGVHVGTPKDHPPPNPKHHNGKNKDKGGGEKEIIDTKPKPTDPKLSLKQRLHHAHKIHSLLATIGVPLIEQAYTAIIRLSARAGDFDRAERYLDEAEHTPQCKVKLRMYSCLMRAYCGELSFSSDDDHPEDATGGGKDAPPITQERLVQALKVWKRMYDHSGGMSTGHPNYSNAKKETEDGIPDKKDGDASTKQQQNQQLFGEGISPKISLTECEYSAIMVAATKLGDASVMERIFSDVADRVLVPGSKTTDIILNWFRADKNKGDSAANSSTSSALDHVTLPPREDPPLCSVTNSNGTGWNIHRGCTVDSKTGKLTLTAPEGEEADAAIANGNNGQYRLKPVELSDRAWKAMQDMNSSIVLEGQVEGHVSKFQGGGKGKKRGRSGNGNGNNNGKNPNNQRQHGNNNGNKSNWRINAWKRFETFIQEHPPYNIVIDGANVGYYEQNFANAPKHINYDQIDWLIRHLLTPSPPSSSSEEEQPKQQKHHIILFLHERHFSHKLAPPWANRIFRSWDSNEAPYNRLTVYRTPAGMNDDWFWMHAALVNGKNGNAAKDEGGPSPCSSVLAITNDEMRDHHFQMLAEGSFLRWKERHQVHFDFGPYDKKLRRREVLLSYPKSYSRRIQWVGCDGGGEPTAIVIPLPKKGDEGRFADGLHVAEDGVPAEETYVVIQRAP
mmetsp:Transcript_19811/g.41740  ORF Transcript_19811/g.41740 Transcript_19811/m.41740 type:complete len:839 (-) Transcript_19811:55-2571(-)